MRVNRLGTRYPDFWGELQNGRRVSESVDQRTGFRRAMFPEFAQVVFVPSGLDGDQPVGWLLGGEE